MTIYQMRERLKTVYRSIRWNKRVDNMTDSQVQAVYLKFVANRKI